MKTDPFTPAPVLVSIIDLADANGIDMQENGIYDEIGTRALHYPLTIHTAPVDFLKSLKGLQTPGRTVWGMQPRIERKSREIISYWETALKRADVGLSDVIVINSDFDRGPVVVDGHHRIIAAIRKNCPLRYVDIAELE